MKVRAGLLAVLILLASAAPSSAALTLRQATARASRLAVAKAELRAHPHAYVSVNGSARHGWEIDYYAGETEILVVIFNPAGSLFGAYTGYKIAWPIARGYPGAFGGDLDALSIWLPLSLLFVAPFFDWRRPLRIVNVDLLALSVFSVSFAFFNHADIAASVPLVYPPLLYLICRLLWLARRRQLPEPALRLNVPIRWLSVAAVCLIAFRVVFNVLGSNVIDVGYANVVGAKRIETAHAVYGHYPSQVANGDTYGPVSYEAYVPFVELLGVGSFTAGNVPAAQAAAIFFDLICVLLLFLLGRQIRGPSTGIVFAYAWAAYPFTALVLESNSNDALVAALILAALLFAKSPGKRGAFAVLAGLAKFAPFAIAPLLLAHRLREDRARGVALFIAAFVLVGVAVSEPAWAYDSLHTIYERTIGYQAGRRTPFSPWGLYGGLGGLQTAVQVIAVALAVVVALMPRRGDSVGLAACAAAVIIAVQLGAGYWFYLYIAWFYAPAIVALFSRYEQRLDGVGAHPLRARHQRAHQPGVLVGG